MTDALSPYRRYVFATMKEWEIRFLPGFAFRWLFKRRLMANAPDGAAYGEWFYELISRRP